MKHDKKGRHLGALKTNTQRHYCIQFIPLEPTKDCLNLIRGAVDSFRGIHQAQMRIDANDKLS